MNTKGLHRQMRNQRHRQCQIWGRGKHQTCFHPCVLPLVHPVITSSFQVLHHKKVVKRKTTTISFVDLIVEKVIYVIFKKYEKKKGQDGCWLGKGVAAVPHEVNLVLRTPWWREELTPTGCPLISVCVCVPWPAHVHTHTLNITRKEDKALWYLKHEFFHSSCWGNQCETVGLD